MKKLSLLLTALAIIACPSIIFATTLATTASSTTFTATLTPGGGEQTWDAALKNVSGNAAASEVTWAAFNAQSPGYKVAQQYIVISASMTNMIAWRMNIYTDNLTPKTGFKPFHTYSTNNTPFADQAAAVSTGSILSYGLVGQGNPTSSTQTANGTCYGLPLAWMVLGVSSAIPVTPVFTTTRGGGNPEGFTNYMWKFVQDKGRSTGSLTSYGAIGSAWDPTATYVRVWDHSGYYWNENPALAATAPAGKVYIYLAVDSTNSRSQNYLTKSLTLDALQL